MPVFRHDTAIKFARDVSLFFRVEAGLTGVGEVARRVGGRLGMRTEATGQASGGSQKAPGGSSEGAAPAWQSKLAEKNQKLAEKNKKLQQVRHRLEKREQEIAELRARLAAGDAVIQEDGIRPENIVWVFGAGRTGSTWLMRMMGEPEHFSMWDEPRVGQVFGMLRGGAHKRGVQGRNFILGEPFRESWVRSIRNFVLDGARARYPHMNPRHYLVVKEPNGSMGATLLSEALPESRLVFLVRDPRDIVSSHMDAASEGGWQTAALKKVGDRATIQFAQSVEQQPDQFAKSAADNLMRSMTGAKQAYDTHRGPKALVRYEDLLSDTLGTMRGIYKSLELPVDQEQLTRAVEKHSWENIPEDQKGEGKFYRKGTPGGWKEDLTPQQIEVVEEVAAPILEEFYPEG